MMNLIRADIYRLRRDAAPKIAIICLLATILLLTFFFKLFSSDGVGEALSQSSAFTQSDAADLEEIKAMIPQNAADFTTMMMAESPFCFFFLFFIITIFAEDYGFGTIRNLLSLESGRRRVYLTKLGLSICCCLSINIVNLLLSLVVGGLAYGFGGITTAFFARQLMCLLLVIPSQLGAICFGHCISAFRQKSGSTIGIYIAGLLVITIVIQLLAMLPTFDWLILLDCNSVATEIYSNQAMSVNEMFITVGFGLLVAAVTTVLGAARFKSADLA